MISPRHVWLVPVMPDRAAPVFSIAEGGYTVHFDFERAQRVAAVMTECTGFKVEPIDLIVEPGTARVPLAL